MIGQSDRNYAEDKGSILPEPDVLVQQQNNHDPNGQKRFQNNPLEIPRGGGIAYFGFLTA
jgi:hypothetical protein